MSGSTTTTALGDVSELREKRVVVNIVRTIVGTHEFGSFRLAADPALHTYTNARGSATVTGPILVNARLAAEKAVVTVVAALVPYQYHSPPTEADHLLTIQGHAHFSKSALSFDGDKNLQFPPGVTEELITRPAVGIEPQLYFDVDVSGVTSTAKTKIVFSVPLTLSGVGFAKTW